MKYVNVYEIERVYGGPEEGGWYYERGEAIDSFGPLGAVEAEAMRDKQQVLADEKNVGRRPLHSVLSDGQRVVRVQDEPAENYPEFRPHYE